MLCAPFISLENVMAGPERLHYVFVSNLRLDITNYRDFMFVFVQKLWALCPSFRRQIAASGDNTGSKQRFCNIFCPLGAPPPSFLDRFACCNPYKQAGCALVTTVKARP
jgi:hypothetical protein